jgi:hypothetical protein
VVVPKKIPKLGDYSGTAAASLRYPAGTLGGTSNLKTKSILGQQGGGKHDAKVDAFCGHSLFAGGELCKRRIFFQTFGHR